MKLIKVTDETHSVFKTACNILGVTIQDAADAALRMMLTSISGNEEEARKILLEAVTGPDTANASLENVTKTFRAEIDRLSDSLR